MEEKRKKKVLGIDLGTTITVGCCYIETNNGMAPRYCQDEGGTCLVPSMVFFPNNSPALVGNPAKNKWIDTVKRSPKGKVPNLISDAKRMIGRIYDDPTVQKFRKHWDFAIEKGTENETGNHDITISVVTSSASREEYKPHEISAMVLSKIKQFAERIFSEPVVDAVITVPAYFGDAERRATKTAGEIAGLNVLRIINEPTAAAVAYASEFPTDGKNILVFDLGGGTLDVTILKSSIVDESTHCEVVATSGDPALGGRDFDTNLLSFLASKFNTVYNCDMEEDYQKQYQELKVDVERIKIRLSSEDEVEVTVDTSDPDIPWVYTVTRSEFEAINENEWKKCITVLSQVFKDQKEITKEQINEVILVGGSSYIPKVRQLVKDFMGKDGHSKLEPELVVARGAALFASVLAGTSDAKLGVSDVIAHDIGVEVEGKEMNVIIERNSRIPAKGSNKYATMVKGAPTVQLKILEGNSKVSQENDTLSTTSLTGYETGNFNIPFEITLQIDRDGKVESIIKCLTDVTWGEKKIVVEKKLTSKFTPEGISSSRDKIVTRMAKMDRKNPPNSSVTSKSTPTPTKDSLAKLSEIVKAMTEIQNAPDLVPLIESTKEWITSNQSASAEVVSSKIKQVIQASGKWQVILDKV